MSSKELYNVVKLVPKPGKFNEVYLYSTQPMLLLVLTSKQTTNKNQSNQRSPRHSKLSLNTFRKTNPRPRSTLRFSRRGPRNLSLLRSETSILV